MECVIGCWSYSVTNEEFQILWEESQCVQQCIDMTSETSLSNTNEKTPPCSCLTNWRSWVPIFAWFAGHSKPKFQWDYRQKRHPRCSCLGQRSLSILFFVHCFPCSRGQIVRRKYNPLRPTHCFRPRCKTRWNVLNSRSQETKLIRLVF